jgi:tryptophan synthase alpha chain
VRKIKAVTRKPVVVGFGVSNPGQAKRIAVLADGVIVGSAIVKITADKKDIVKNVSRFATSIAKAVHQSAH